jgi:hypothetical protein
MPPVEGPDDLSDVKPGESGWPRVELRGHARPHPPARREKHEKELAYVFGTSRPDVELVLVVKSYRGYSQADDSRAVFGVELRLRNDQGYETHIVKLGSDAEVGRDAANWDACTRGREVASRVCAAVRKVPVRTSGRVAVIYRDAYTLFGPGEAVDTAPRDLETVAEEAVFTNTVDPESVERALAHIFTDLSLWFFFPGAAPDADAARAFYRRELVSQKTGADALARWAADAQRLDLRRDALWLFCGRDRPDADHAMKPARYLDPVELVGWALETGRLPETLVGRGHGDLHGRNVLLGVRRAAAEYPAVFDYGGMGAANVLAWDFAKLETELKVRLLQKLYRNDAAHKAVRAHAGWTWKQPAEPHDDTTHRAERLRFFFIFEEMLAERTAWITGREVAEAWRPPGGRKPTRVEELNRLLALLLRIRQEAALALGFLAERVAGWRDELFFALAVCGLVNARWTTYTEPQAESALVSAGVAAAHAPFVRQAVAELAARATLSPPPYPSYRVPLAHAHRHWKASRREGKAILDGLVPGHGHAVPLIAEQALFHCEAGEFARVQEQLRSLTARAQAFDDEETLTRLGRAFKEMGDESWERSGLPFHQLDRHPAVQFYRAALQVYDDAYRLNSHYFPGINVAVLALLVGEDKRAEQAARKLGEDCATMTIQVDPKRREDDKTLAVPPEELYWVLATEGDAALILRNADAALGFYRDAILCLQKGSEDQYAVSSYRQLLRLRGPLGAGLVNPVLKLFDEDPVLGPVLRQAVTRHIPG